jgi:hypothetical protein
MAALQNFVKELVDLGTALRMRLLASGVASYARVPCPIPWMYQPHVLF